MGVWVLGDRSTRGRLLLGVLGRMLAGLEGWWGLEGQRRVAKQEERKGSWEKVSTYQ